MRRVLYLMGSLEDQDIEWMMRAGSSRYVEPGAVIIHEGVPAGCLFVVLDGAFSVQIGQQQPGKEVAVLYAGEVVGEISFVDSRPPTATVRAAQPSHVLAIPRDRLQQELERNVPFAARFYKAIAMFLADRMRVTTGRLGYGTADQDKRDVTELNDDLMDGVAIAASRFDQVLRRLRVN
jgi:CRP/FNR family transcriptional regulator, cyclic AMP receptor protein